MQWHDLIAGIAPGIVPGIAPEEPSGDRPVEDRLVEVLDIVHDSRRARPGVCFACIPGARSDGHDHAAAAVAQGAVVLLVERPLPLDVPQAQVGDVRAVLGPLAARLHGDPSRTLRCLGVTGTNGKTTVTYLLESITAALGEQAGVIGTIGARVGRTTLPTGFTTPEASDLQALLADMRDRGVTTVAIEVSSHALAQGRVDGVSFAAACFTNVSHEHLDFHGTLEAYFEAKASLFDPVRTPAAAINVDDEHGRRLAAMARDRGLDVWTFGVATSGTDLSARDIVPQARGTALRLHDVRADTHAVVTLSLAGVHNVSNALAAAATARAAGIASDAVIAGLSTPVIVPGRMERVDVGQPFEVLVDYAHTPAALASVLDAARELTAGRLIVVFGCGGDRDREKRPLMGAAVARRADIAFLTSDNPRSEQPAAIAAAVLDGMAGGSAQVVVELDRRAAIESAIEEAAPGDVVVIAGKGHESGQTIGEQTFPFDDRVVAGRVGAVAVELTASEVARLTEGAVVVGHGHVVASSFAIDSRVVEPGGCFVALTAARDGHDFVGDALARGAATAIVARLPSVDVPAPAAVVRVDDPLVALGRLGTAARRALPAARVVGVTGSTGKTGTKDLVAGALAARYRVHASPLSFNNEAGVPLSLLAAPADADHVVLELGARFPDNIAALCEIARPNVGVVTNIGLAHAGLLGGVEGVARVKGELLEALAPGNLAVLNGDDPSTPGLRARTRADVVTAAVTDREADVRGSRVELDDELRARFVLESSWGRTSVALGVHGAHQVTNALLAAAVALWAGVEPDEVAAGLAAVRGAPMRMEVVRVPGGPVVLNDTYNANPASMAAAIDALGATRTPRRRIAVLGAMRELGEWSEQEHARVGRQVADAPVDALVAVGSDTAALAAGARHRARETGRPLEVFEVAEAQEALERVRDLVGPGDVVLVKASRAVGLELVAAGLIRGEVRT